MVLGSGFRVQGVSCCLTCRTAHGQGQGQGQGRQGQGQRLRRQGLAFEFPRGFCIHIRVI